MKVGDLYIIDMGKPKVRDDFNIGWLQFYPKVTKLVVIVHAFLKHHSVYGNLGPSRMAVQCKLVKAIGLPLTPGRIDILNTRSTGDISGWWYPLEILEPYSNANVVSEVLRKRLSVSDAAKHVMESLT